jgi:hypothetical protein
MKVLVKLHESYMYPMIDKLLRLVVDFPISTVTTKIVFLDMELVKNTSVE